MGRLLTGGSLGFLIGWLLTAALYECDVVAPRHTWPKAPAAKPALPKTSAHPLAEPARFRQDLPRVSKASMASGSLPLAAFTLDTLRVLGVERVDTPAGSWLRAYGTLRAARPGGLMGTATVYLVYSVLRLDTGERFVLSHAGLEEFAEDEDRTKRE